MSGINTGKVVTGGLVAGLVFAIIDFITNTFLIGAEFTANATRLGIDPAALESASVIATTVIVDFLFGILVVFLYAAIRPRFGPGSRTAVIAGVLPYLAIFLVMLIMKQVGIFTTALFVKFAVIQLISSILGALAGAALYKEA